MTTQIAIAPRSKVAGLLWLVATLGFGAALLIAWRAYETSVAIAELNANNAHLKSLQQKAARKPSRHEVEEAKRWDALRAERAFPWPRLLASIERAIDPDVELIELRPDPRTKVFVVKGHAQSAEAIQRYLGLLAGDANLSRVSLMRQTTLDKPQGGILEFEIRAVLRVEDTDSRD